MRNVKYAILRLFVAESPKFPCLKGNRDGRTRWRRQIVDRKSWTCELGYGADTVFHGTHFLFLFIIYLFSFFLYLSIITYSDSSHRHRVFTFVCLCVLLFIFARCLKTDAAWITELDMEMFHDNSLKPINFGFRKSRLLDTKILQVSVFVLLSMLAFSSQCMAASTYCRLIFQWTLPSLRLYH